MTMRMLRMTMRILRMMMMCDAIFLVRPQGKFEIDHYWE